MKRKILGIFLTVILLATNALPVFAMDSNGTLTALQIENFAVLCKTWGLVKFYHPECLNDSEKMDRELLSLIPNIEKATSREERDGILLKWVMGLPGLTRPSENKKQPASSEVNELAYSKKLYGDYTRTYDGNKWISALSNELKDQLNAIINADRTAIKKLNFVDENGFHNFDHESQYLDLKVVDKNHRLLSLFRFWNVFEFFSPNKDLLEENWDTVLRDLIPSFYSAESTLDYQAALRKMGIKTNDSHTSITGTRDYLTNQFGEYFIPVNLISIEGNVVVSNSITKQALLKKGDIITHINGVPMNALLKGVEYYPYSNDTGRINGAMLINKYSKQKTNQVTISRDGKSTILAIDNITKNEVPTATVPPVVEPIKKIEKDIYYVNYGYLTPESEAELIQLLKTAKTVIMDNRVYPMEHMAEYSTIDNFLPYQKPLIEYDIVDIYNPGNLFKVTVQSASKVNPNFYKGELICLVSDQTVSHTEFTTIRYRKAPKAIVLGSQTTGADGDIVSVPLVGPYKIYYSSIGVHDIDGSETQRVGVKVDIPQVQTLKGYISNEDDLLNAALKLAKTLRDHKVETRKINGVEMVPLRQALMNRPFEFSFDSGSKTFTLKNGAEKTTIALGKKTYPRFDGASITLKSAPVVFNGSLYVPKEYLMQVLSLELSFK